MCSSAEMALWFGVFLGGVAGEEEGDGSVTAVHAAPCVPPGVAADGALLRASGSGAARGDGLCESPLDSPFKAKPLREALGRCGSNATQRSFEAPASLSSVRRREPEQGGEREGILPPGSGPCFIHLC